MENMMDAATARYRKEAAKLMRCKEIVREMNERGDKSSNERAGCGERKCACPVCGAWRRRSGLTRPRWTPSPMRKKAR